MSRVTLPDGLVEQALAARERAYAPYSGYAVGAAVLTASGAIVQGCNVENAVYGATVCAERVAAWRAVAAGAGATAVAVATIGGGAPCGICRQVLLELGSPELPVGLVDVRAPADEPRVLRLEELLPHAWTAAELRQDAEAAG